MQAHLVFWQAQSSNPFPGLALLQKTIELSYSLPACVSSFRYQACFSTIWQLLNLLSENSIKSVTVCPHSDAPRRAAYLNLRRKMNHQSVPGTLVRLFAIGLVMYAFRNAHLTMLFFSEGSYDVSDIYLLLSGIAVPALIAVVLWIDPSKAVGRYSAGRAEGGVSNLDPRDMFRVGVALMGLYLAVTAAPVIVDWLALFYRSQNNLAGDIVYRPSSAYFEIYSEVLLLIVGLLFFFGSSAVARLFSYARNFGVDSAAPAETRLERASRGSRAAKREESDDGAG